VSTNIGDVAAYDGTLNVTGCFTADVRAVPGFGDPHLLGKVDPIYFTVLASIIHGSAGFQISDYEFPSDKPDGLAVTEVSILATDWRSAVYKAVDGWITVNKTGQKLNFPHNATPPTFANSTLASSAFLVGTAQQLRDAVRAYHEATDSGHVPYHPRGTNDVFDLGLDPTAKVIVFEDLTDVPLDSGWINDKDYDDAYWKVGVASGDLAIDSNNNSLTGDPLPHRATDTSGGYVDDTREDQAPGKYIAVQAKDANGPISGTTFTPMAITVNDFTPNVSKIRFVAKAINGTNPDNSAFVLHTGNAVGNAGATINVSDASSYLIQTANSTSSAGFSGGQFNLVSNNPVTLYVQALKAGIYNVELKIDPLDDGNWKSVDTVRFMALDPNVTCLECTYGLTVNLAGVDWLDEASVGGRSVTMNSALPGDTRFGQPAVLVLTGNGVAVLEKDKVDIWDYNDAHTVLKPRKPQSQGDMKANGSGSSLVFQETLDGTKWTFTAPIADNPPNYFGHLISQIDAASNETDYYYFSGTDQLASMISTVGPDYSYSGNGQNIHHSQQMVAYTRNGSVVTCENVANGYADGINSGDGTTLVAGTGSGTGNAARYWHPSATVGSTNYAYHSSGNLGLIVSRDSAGNVSGGSYYRYDGSGQLKFSLGPQSLARLLAAKGLTLDNFTVFQDLLSSLDNTTNVPDTTVATYADNALTYDANGLVTSNTVAGSGTTSYTNARSTFADGINTWSNKQVTSQTVNGTTTRTFTNYEGDVLLSDVWNGASGAAAHQITCNKYDANGNLIESTQPSAIDTTYSHTDSSTGYVEYGYDSSQANLGVSLSATGLVNVNDYTTTTTDAPDYSDSLTVGGGVIGYLRRSGVRQGNTGPTVWQFETDYVKKTTGSGSTAVTVYLPFRSIEYPNADGSSPRVTTTRYSFYDVGGTIAAPAIKTRQTILPVVHTDQGGAVAVDDTTTPGPTSTEVYGRVIWSKDAAGSISYTAYDPATGAVVKQIRDVNNLTGTTDFSSASIDLVGDLGWSVTSGSHAHLITRYVVDSLGRTTEEVDPDNNTTYTVYNDANHEVRTYPGWHAVSTGHYQTTSPVSVSREDWSNKYSEFLTYSWNDSSGFSSGDLNEDGSPKGTELLSDSHVVIQSLSRSLVDDLGQATESREYFTLLGLSDNGYATSVNLGSAGAHYLASDGYRDPIGRTEATVDPSGSIHYTVYDGLGRVSDEWAGTVPSTNTYAANQSIVLAFRTWVYSNSNVVYSATGVHLYKLSHSVYDVNGNVVESWSYFDPTGIASPRKAYYQYDSQDRQIASLGPDGVANVSTLDNLGETTQTLTYANAIYDTSTHQIVVSEATLLASSESLFDNQGSVYESIVHDVNSFATLVSETWHDVMGRTIKTQQPDGLIQKTTYNSFGEVDAEYTVSSEGTDPGITDDTIVSVTKYDYDSAGRQIDVKQGTSLGTTSIVSRTWYDSDHTGSGAEQYRATGVSTLKPGSDSTFVLTIYGYDDAGRQNVTVSPLGGSTKNVFDMLGRATDSYTYASYDFTTPSNPGLVIAHSENVYSNDRLFQSKQHEVIGGTETANSIVTTYTTSSDQLGRQNVVIGPTGAATVTAYDLEGNVLTQQSYAAPANWTPPTDPSASLVLGNQIGYSENVYDPTHGRLNSIKHGITLANAVTVTQYFFNTDAVGNTTSEQGRLTAVDSLVASSGTAWARTSYGYDGYGRQNLTTTPAPGGSLHAVTTEQLYDDSTGQPTITMSYWTTDGGTTKHYVSESQNVYSGIYLSDTQRYQVSTDTDTSHTPNETTEPISGGLPHLDTHYTYGAYGRVVKTTNPDGSFTASDFSLDGTVRSSYQGAYLGTGSDPGIGGDMIVSQVDYQYDSTGDVILATSYQRHEDSTATGPFSPSTTDARVSYVAVWYDSLGRKTDMADYGALGSALTRPTNVPSRSPTDPTAPHITSFEYDGYGRQNLVTDPKGKKTLQVFDSLGRTIDTIDNFKVDSSYWGTPTSGADPYSQPLARPSDVNQITHFDYNLAGQLLDQIVLDPKCDGNESGYQADNQATRYVYASDLSTLTSGQTGDQLMATVYPDCTLTDTAVLAAVEANAANPGTQTGGTAGYDIVANTYYANGAQATETDPRGVVHQYVFDNLGRVTEDDVASLGISTENVDPTVQAIVTSYNDRGLTASVTSYDSPNIHGTDNVKNQVVYTHDGWGNVATSKQDHSDTVGGSTPEVAYTYDNSLDRLTNVIYPTSRTVGYSYGSSGTIDNALSRVAAITDGSSTTYAAYTYLGAGAIVNTAHPDVTNGLDLTLGTAQNGYNGLDQWGRVVDQVWESGGVKIDEYKYDYDAIGNRTKRENVQADLAGKSLSETYAYDEVYRLIGTQRGQFADGVFTGSDYQGWTLDGLGNWSGFIDGTTSQTRVTNAANELESITVSGTPTAVSHDLAGNLTTDGNLRYKYDAWNRQTQVLTTGDSPIASYSYDGLNRRITKVVDGGSTTQYIYNENWQVLEEKSVEGANTSVNQYAWDLSYIDTPVARLRDAANDGTFEQTLYYMTDANHNVTGLVDASTGNVVERYAYTPYGVATVLYGNDRSGTDWSPEMAGSNAVSASPYGNEILYAGYRYDPETVVVASSTAGASGNYHVRNRQYSPLIGQFAERDPLGYAAGDENLYRYVGGRPTDGTDPSGTDDGLESSSGDSGNWPQPWIPDNYKRTDGAMTLELYNKTKKSTVFEMAAQKYDPIAGMNVGIDTTKDQLFKGSSPPFVKISYAPKGLNGRVVLVQIVRLVYSNGLVEKYSGSEFKNSADKEYLINNWVTAANKANGIDAGWHVDENPRTAHGQVEYSGEHLAGLSSASGSYREAYLWDSPGISAGRKVNGVQFQFETYAACQSSPDAIAIVLDGVKWGFEMNTIQQRISGFWSSVETISVFKMLPTTFTGHIQSANFKEAIRRYTVYYGTSAIFQ